MVDYASRGLYGVTEIDEGPSHHRYVLSFRWLVCDDASADLTASLKLVKQLAIATVQYEEFASIFSRECQIS